MNGIMRSLNKRLLHFFLATSLVFPACSHHTKKQEMFNSELVAGNCDKAYLQLPDENMEMKLVRQSKEALGTVSSYAVAGGGYVVEVLWDIVGGTVMAVALCGPTMVALAASSSTGSNTHLVKCLPGDIKTLGAPPLGRRSYQATRSWRCPDLTAMSHSMRQVSACYQKRGGVDDLRSAQKHLRSLRASDEFYSCLPEEEKATVDHELQQVTQELALKEVSSNEGVVQK